MLLSFIWNGHDEQKTVAATANEPKNLSKLLEQFTDFVQQCSTLFKSQTHSRKVPLLHYLKGLLQTEPGKRNMTRMAEKVVQADEQSLQHFISKAQWDEQKVLDFIALEADKWLGGQADRSLVVDESGFEKKGKHSVGVARQWNGNKGKVDNCQVGVFLALASGHRATLINQQLYLPKAWTEARARCHEAGISAEKIVFKTKPEQALEMIHHAQKLSVRYQWVNCDGLYGKDAAFLRTLNDMGETFMADVHQNQRVYLEDPKPVIPPRQSARGKAPKRLQAQSLPLRVDELAKHQPVEAWQRVKLRDSTKGFLFVKVLHRRIWVWDGREAQAHCWHLLVRRPLNASDDVKYSLSNAQADTPLPRLAFMQGQRYWVERAIQDGKQECGLADYQVRQWRGWHHHMALCMMVMLLMLKQRVLNQAQYPLLSCRDLRVLLRHFLPKRDVTTEEIIRQLEARHRKRQSAIRSAYKKYEAQFFAILDG